MIRDRTELAVSEAHDLALSCIESGVEAAHPAAIIESSAEQDDGTLTVNGETYSLEAYSDVIVVGTGNAAGRVASELEPILGTEIDDGVVVTDDPVDVGDVTMVEGKHPVPSERAVEGARLLLERLRNADEETLVLAIMTGGGSALLPAPAGDLNLADLRAVTDALLESGATIHEINAVRKHLSDTKGGKLAAEAAPATVVGVVFSDVVGNNLDVIAGGPLVHDSSTYDDALAVIDRYDLDVPNAVEDHLRRGRSGTVEEMPGPDDPVFARVDVHVLADGMTALEAAAETARSAGYEARILSSRVRGEAREAAKTHVAIAEEVRASGTPVEPPAVLLSGGETTVTLTRDGTGGPNQEFVLSSAIELEEAAVVAAVDTDGIDGATNAAGAIADADTCSGTIDAAREALADNDAYPFLADRDTLIRTGVTGTNVNDLRVLVVDARE